jgi:hypothetical protein
VRFRVHSVRRRGVEFRFRFEPLLKTKGRIGFAS